MNKKKLNIFIFIDALGWEIARENKFLEDILPYRYPVKMQFGYSSTAIPTILTGQPPRVHKHLSFYYYSPQTSPFRIFRYLMLDRLPSRISRRWRFRHAVSKMLAGLYGFTGYFELYAMPFRRLPFFDYSEKKDIFVPGGLSPVPNLADELVKRRIPYHMSDWRRTEKENIEALSEDIRKGEIRFAFLYTAALDGNLHRLTKHGDGIKQCLDWYATKIKQLINTVKTSGYSDCSVTVISDHGMTDTVGTIDVQKEVESCGLEFGSDYAAVYDSTMARLWFLNDTAGHRIVSQLEKIPHSHILDGAEKKEYGVDFEDDMYGECILLMDPGWQIEPSDMGLKAPPGMHGFTPGHPDSNASFLSNYEPENPPEWVGDYFRIMLDAAGK